MDHIWASEPEPGYEWTFANEPVERIKRPALADLGNEGADENGGQASRTGQGTA